MAHLSFKDKYGDITSRLMDQLDVPLRIPWLTKILDKLFQSVLSHLFMLTEGLQRDLDGFKSKIEKVPRGIRGEKSSKDMASSRNLVSTIGALASPKIGDGTRYPEG